jgi:hypothetical protein
LLGQLIEQGSGSRGPGGAGFQLCEPLHQQGSAQGGSAYAQAVGLGLQLGGALGTLPQYRYLQQLAVLAPLLVLAGLTAPWRLLCRPGGRA